MPDQDLDHVLERMRKLEKDYAVLQSEFKSLRKEVDGFESGVARGLWLVGGGFVMALVSWVINGGLGGKVQ